MQAYEFSTAVEDNGIIRIPEEYLKDISSTVKVIIFTKNERTLVREPQPKRKTFKAMKIHTKGFKFNREEVNER
ncbi:hypothetical protein FACS189444_3050 [Spirochaetia bacterium]|nr:hypothetical protein FACS189444_3050 [Spirochaetia bacterium]